MSQPGKAPSTVQLVPVRAGHARTNLYFAQARAQSAQAHARVSAMRNMKELLATHRAGPLRSS